MAEEKKKETKEGCDCDLLKEKIELLSQELEQVKRERDQYAMACNDLMNQNNNFWGIYSNTLDYLINQTTKKGK